MTEEYKKIIDSFYWACMVNKNTIVENAARDQIQQSIKDLTCKAWKLKLKGQNMTDPQKLVDEEDLPIVPQTASQMTLMKLAEVWELVKEEMAEKSPKQVKIV